MIPSQSNLCRYSTPLPKNMFVNYLMSFFVVRRVYSIKQHICGFLHFMINESFIFWHEKY